MKILYSQSNFDNENLSKPSLLGHFGIENCFLRFAESADHFSTLSPIVHQHASVEIHLIMEGAQQYHAQNTLYTISAGHFLLIPSDIPHQHISTVPNTRKYTICFSISGGGSYDFAPFFEKKLIFKAVTPSALAALADIEKEADFKGEYSIPLMESKLFQFLLYLARDCGICEDTSGFMKEKDPRLSLAQQYIGDNIERSISCQEVADYCHLSQKQLARLFGHGLGISIANYIRSQRIARIRQLLIESCLSLEQISEKMHFSNVYHFNTFFSKYAGVSPGRFRKMPRG